jgi:hypothetical protein
VILTSIPIHKISGLKKKAREMVSLFSMKRIMIKSSVYGDVRLLIHNDQYLIIIIIIIKYNKKNQYIGILGEGQVSG